MSINTKFSHLHTKIIVEPIWLRTSKYNYIQIDSEKELIYYNLVGFPCKHKQTIKVIFKKNLITTKQLNLPIANNP